MNSALPHFGAVVDEICDCVHSEEFPDSPPHPIAVLSERTKRTISSGQPVKTRTWEEYACELVHVLVNSQMFFFDATDRQRLFEAFHSYRRSYEGLNDTLTRLRASPDTVQRSVIRLVVLDMAVRRVAVCIGSGVTPNEDFPSWAGENGPNEFWKKAMAKRYPGLPLVDSGEPDGDCATRLGMNSSKMRRCLYENDFPGPAALKTVCSKTQEAAAALRYYAASKLCRKLAGKFGKSEEEYWAGKLAKVVKWLHELLEPILRRFSETERQRLLKRILIGGVGDEMIQGLLREHLTARIPPAWRADLLAIAYGKPQASIVSYVEFCSNFDQPPEAGCWEEAFDHWQAEMESFVQTGELPGGDNASDKLLLTRLLAMAENDGDFAGQERILRQIIVNDPREPEPHQLLAELFEERGQLAEACEEFERAAALNPNFVLPLYSLADLKSKSGQHNEALRVLTRIPDDGLGPGSRAYLAGVLLLRAGKLNDAIPILEAAHRIGWEPGFCAALLAWAYQRIEPQSPASHHEAKRWEKQAQHRGVSTEEAVAKFSIS